MAGLNEKDGKVYLTDENDAVVGLALGSMDVPKAMGLVAWTFPPMLATVAGTPANLHAGAVALTKGDVIKALTVPVTVAGVTMTYSGLGIYDQNLVKLASIEESGAAFQATGWIERALATPWKCPLSGVYYLAHLFVGATRPTILQFTVAPATSLPLPSGLAYGYEQVAPGALPNPIVPASGTLGTYPCIVAR